MSALREVILGVVVAAGIIAAMEPAGTWGTYSQLEVSLAVLAFAACASIGIPPRPSPPVPVPLALLLVLMGASAIWGSASWLTVRDTATYAIFAAAAWILVRNARLSTIVIGVTSAGAVILLASLGVLLIDADAALFYESSGFQGIYSNRNTFGFVMTLVIPAALALPARSMGGRLVKLLVVAMLVAGAAFSLSKTTMAVVLLILVLWLALVLARRSLWYPAAIGAVGVVAVVVAAVNASRVLDFLGKDATINGRSEIWAGVLRVVPESPFIGFGWTRSWPLESPQSLSVARELDGHVVFHAHNELLNWLVTTGALGAVLIVIVYGFATWAGLRSFWAGADRPELIWLPLAAVSLIARGLSDISETNAQAWFTLMLVVFACARHLPSPAEPQRPLPFFIRVPGQQTRQEILRMECNECSR